MKIIYCPNCGKNVVRKYKGFLHDEYHSTYICQNCNSEYRIKNETNIIRKIK